MASYSNPAQQTTIQQQRALRAGLNVLGAMRHKSSDSGKRVRNELEALLVAYNKEIGLSAAASTTTTTVSSSTTSGSGSTSTSFVGDGGGVGRVKDPKAKQYAAAISLAPHPTAAAADENKRKGSAVSAADNKNSSSSSKNTKQNVIPKCEGVIDLVGCNDINDEEWSTLLNIIAIHPSVSSIDVTLCNALNHNKTLQQRFIDTVKSNAVITDVQTDSPIIAQALKATLKHHQQIAQRRNELREEQTQFDEELSMEEVYRAQRASEEENEMAIRQLIEHQWLCAVVPPFEAFREGAIALAHALNAKHRRHIFLLNVEAVVKDACVTLPSRLFLLYLERLASIAEDMESTLRSEIFNDQNMLRNAIRRKYFKGHERAANKLVARLKTEHEDRQSLLGTCIADKERTIISHEASQRQLLLSYKNKYFERYRTFESSVEIRKQEMQMKVNSRVDEFAERQRLKTERMLIKDSGKGNVTLIVEMDRITRLEQTIRAKLHQDEEKAFDSYCEILLLCRNIADAREVVGGAAKVIQYVMDNRKEGWDVTKSNPSAATNSHGMMITSSAAGGILASPRNSAGPFTHNNTSAALSPRRNSPPNARHLSAAKNSTTTAPQASPRRRGGNGNDASDAPPPHSAANVLRVLSVPLSLRPHEHLSFGRLPLHALSSSSSASTASSSALFLPTKEVIPEIEQIYYPLPSSSSSHSSVSASNRMSLQQQQLMGNGGGGGSVSRSQSHTKHRASPTTSPSTSPLRENNNNNNNTINNNANNTSTFASPAASGGGGLGIRGPPITAADGGVGGGVDDKDDALDSIMVDDPLIAAFMVKDTEEEAEWRDAFSTAVHNYCLAVRRSNLIIAKAAAQIELLMGRVYSTMLSLQLGPLVDRLRTPPANSNNGAASSPLARHKSLRRTTSSSSYLIRSASASTIAHGQGNNNNNTTMTVQSAQTVADFGSVAGSPTSMRRGSGSMLLVDGGGGGSPTLGSASASFRRYRTLTAPPPPTTNSGGGGGGGLLTNTSFTNGNSGPVVPTLCIDTYRDVLRRRYFTLFESPFTHAAAAATASGAPTPSSTVITDAMLDALDTLATDAIAQRRIVRRITITINQQRRSNRTPEGGGGDKEEAESAVVRQSNAFIRRVQCSFATATVNDADDDDHSLEEGSNKKEKKKNPSSTSTVQGTAPLRRTITIPTICKLDEVQELIDRNLFIAPQQQLQSSAPSHSETALPSSASSLAAVLPIEVKIACTMLPLQWSQKGNGVTYLSPPSPSSCHGGDGVENRLHSAFHPWIGTLTGTVGDEGDDKQKHHQHAASSVSSSPSPHYTMSDAHCVVSKCLLNVSLLKPLFTLLSNPSAHSTAHEHHVSNQCGGDSPHITAADRAGVNGLNNSPRRRSHSNDDEETTFTKEAPPSMETTSIHAKNNNNCCQQQQRTTAAKPLMDECHFNGKFAQPFKSIMINPDTLREIVVAGITDDDDDCHDQDDADVDGCFASSPAASPPRRRVADGTSAGEAARSPSPIAPPLNDEGDEGSGEKKKDAVPREIKKRTISVTIAIRCHGMTQPSALTAVPEWDGVLLRSDGLGGSDDDDDDAPLSCAGFETMDEHSSNNGAGNISGGGNNVIIEVSSNSNNTSRGGGGGGTQSCEVSSSALLGMYSNVTPTSNSVTPPTSAGRKIGGGANNGLLLSRPPPALSPRSLSTSTMGIGGASGMIAGDTASYTPPALLSPTMSGGMVNSTASNNNQTAAGGTHNNILRKCVFGGLVLGEGWHGIPVNPLVVPTATATAANNGPNTTRPRGSVFLNSTTGRGGGGSLSPAAAAAAASIANSSNSTPSVHKFNIVFNGCIRRRLNNGTGGPLLHSHSDDEATVEKEDIFVIADNTANNATTTTSGSAGNKNNACGAGGASPQKSTNNSVINDQATMMNVSLGGPSETPPLSINTASAVSITITSLPTVFPAPAGVALPSVANLRVGPTLSSMSAAPAFTVTFSTVETTTTTTTTTTATTVVEDTFNDGVAENEYHRKKLFAQLAAVIQRFLRDLHVFVPTTSHIAVPVDAAAMASRLPNALVSAPAPSPAAINATAKALTEAMHQQQQQQSNAGTGAIGSTTPNIMMVPTLHGFGSGRFGSDNNTLFSASSSAQNLLLAAATDGPAYVETPEGIAYVTMNLVMPQSPSSRGSDGNNKASSSPSSATANTNNNTVVGQRRQSSASRSNKSPPGTKAATTSGGVVSGGGSSINSKFKFATGGGGGGRRNSSVTSNTMGPVPSSSPQRRKSLAQSTRSGGGRGAADAAPSASFNTVDEEDGGPLALLPPKTIGGGGEHNNSGQTEGTYLTVKLINDDHIITHNINTTSTSASASHRHQNNNNNNNNPFYASTVSNNSLVGTMLSGDQQQGNNNNSMSVATTCCGSNYDAAVVEAKVVTRPSASIEVSMAPITPSSIASSRVMIEKKSGTLSLAAAARTLNEQQQINAIAAAAFGGGGDGGGNSPTTTTTSPTRGSLFVGAGLLGAPRGVVAGGGGGRRTSAAKSGASVAAALALMKARQGFISWVKLAGPSNALDVIMRRQPTSREVLVGRLGITASTNVGATTNADATSSSAASLLAAAAPHTNNKDSSSSSATPPPLTPTTTPQQLSVWYCQALEQLVQRHTRLSCFALGSNLKLAFNWKRRGGGGEGDDNDTGNNKRINRQQQQEREPQTFVSFAITFEAIASAADRASLGTTNLALLGGRAGASTATASSSSLTPQQQQAAMANSVRGDLIAFLPPYKMVKKGSSMSSGGSAANANDGSHSTCDSSSSAPACEGGFVCHYYTIKDRREKEEGRRGGGGGGGGDNASNNPLTAYYGIDGAVAVDSAECSPAADGGLAVPKRTKKTPPALLDTGAVSTVGKNDSNARHNDDDHHDHHASSSSDSESGASDILAATASYLTHHNTLTVAAATAHQQNHHHNGGGSSSDKQNNNGSKPSHQQQQQQGGKRRVSQSGNSNGAGGGSKTFSSVDGSGKISAQQQVLSQLQQVGHHHHTDYNDASGGGLFPQFSYLAVQCYSNVVADSLCAATTINAIDMCGGIGGLGLVSVHDDTAELLDLLDGGGEDAHSPLFDRRQRNSGGAASAAVADEVPSVAPSSFISGGGNMAASGIFSSRSPAVGGLSVGSMGRTASTMGGMSDGRLPPQSTTATTSNSPSKGIGGKPLSSVAVANALANKDTPFTNITNGHGPIVPRFTKVTFLGVIPTTMKTKRKRRSAAPDVPAADGSASGSRRPSTAVPPSSAAGYDDYYDNDEDFDDAEEEEVEEVDSVVVDVDAAIQRAIDDHLMPYVLLLSDPAPKDRSVKLVVTTHVSSDLDETAPELPWNNEQYLRAEKLNKLMRRARHQEEFGDDEDDKYHRRSSLISTSSPQRAHLSKADLNVSGADSMQRQLSSAAAAAAADEDSASVSSRPSISPTIASTNTTTVNGGGGGGGGRERAMSIETVGGGVLSSLKRRKSFGLNATINGGTSSTGNTASAAVVATAGSSKQPSSSASALPTNPFAQGCGLPLYDYLWRYGTTRTLSTPITIAHSKLWNAVAAAAAAKGSGGGLLSGGKMYNNNSNASIGGGGGGIDSAPYGEITVRVVAATLPQSDGGATTTALSSNSKGGGNTSGLNSNSVVASSGAGGSQLTAVGIDENIFVLPIAPTSQVAPNNFCYSSAGLGRASSPSSPTAAAYSSPTRPSSASGKAPLLRPMSAAKQQQSSSKPSGLTIRIDCSLASECLFRFENIYRPFIPDHLAVNPNGPSALAADGYTNGGATTTRGSNGGGGDNRRDSTNTTASTGRGNTNYNNGSGDSSQQTTLLNIVEPLLTLDIENRTVTHNASGKVVATIHVTGGRAPPRHALDALIAYHREYTHEIQQQFVEAAVSSGDLIPVVNSGGAGNSNATMNTLQLNNSGGANSLRNHGINSNSATTAQQQAVTRRASLAALRTQQEATTGSSSSSLPFIIGCESTIEIRFVHDIVDLIMTTKTEKDNNPTAVTAASSTAASSTNSTPHLNATTATGCGGSGSGPSSPTNASDAAATTTGTTTAPPMAIPLLPTAAIQQQQLPKFPNTSPSAGGGGGGGGRGGRTNATTAALSAPPKEVNPLTVSKQVLNALLRTHLFISRIPLNPHGNAAPSPSAPASTLGAAGGLVGNNNQNNADADQTAESFNSNTTMTASTASSPLSSANGGGGGGFTTTTVPPLPPTPPSIASTSPQALEKVTQYALITASVLGNDVDLAHLGLKLICS